MTDLTDETLLAYAAGALPEDERARIALRVAADPEAQGRLADWARQDAALSALYNPVAEEPLPARFTALLAAARAPRPRRPLVTALFRLAAAVALLAVGATGGWLAHGTAPANVEQALTLAAATAHETYIVEAVHPVEVPASNAAHLTTWISKRLGHPIHAPDFASAGFTLMGGRVLPAPTGTAALFMYVNAKGERMTLYVAPKGSAKDTAFRFFEADGTQGFWWVDTDLCYAITGTFPRDTLRRVAAMAYDQLL